MDYKVSEDMLQAAAENYGSAKHPMSKIGAKESQEDFLAGARWYKEQQDRLMEENGICCMKFDDIEDARIAAYEQGKADLREEMAMEG